MLNLLAAMLFAALLLLRFAPDTSLARWVHIFAVELPAKKILALRRRDLIFLILVAGLMIAGAEVIAVLGSSELMLAYATDLSIYFDTVLAAYAIAIASRFGQRKSTVLALGRNIRMTRGGRSSGRRKRIQKSSPQSAENDDDHHIVVPAA